VREIEYVCEKEERERERERMRHSNNILIPCARVPPLFRFRLCGNASAATPRCSARLPRPHEDGKNGASGKAILFVTSRISTFLLSFSFLLLLLLL